MHETMHEKTHKIARFNITKDLANLIDSTIEQTGKNPTIILTGIATNIATFLRAFPTYTAKIDKVFWLGGALNVPGNVFTVSNDSRAEYNIYLDCVAARKLIASDLDITLVPLDFTNQLPLSPGVFDKLSKLKSFYGKFVYKLLSIIRKVKPTFFATYYLWDSITIAIAKDIGVAKIVSNHSLTVTCKGDQIYDRQFIKSKTLLNSNFKAAIDAIVSKPIENSPFYQDFLNVIDCD
ncbi:Inosine/uridine-preferring nucleoside hydrolase domain-containing protein [Gigaspora rosea]|uniref:Inosine/uridine-preferring nucleoside hydrolase domain-containing protein n=1 Tax=Gigaspora rosea TaxID=44941 RepID=A0A397W7K7_9GLOM|nr:Inosine/uridine-preferring nucleoside hydrolase domain-containing protein [Gigaspora rosea]